MEQYLTAEVKRGAMYFAIVGAVLGIIGAIPLLNCLALPLLCVSAFAVPLVIGWLVAQWSGASEMAQGALPGAIACGVGQVIAGAVTFVATLCFNVFFSVLGVTSSGDAAGMMTGLLAAAVAGIASWIFGVIFAAIFGAVGGLLYVAIQGNKTKPT